MHYHFSVWKCADEPVSAVYQIFCLVTCRYYPARSDRQQTLIKLIFKDDRKDTMVTVWEKYDSYEQTDNKNCPECGTPNACNVHRWLNTKWYRNYKIEKKK